ncbi:beta-galactosidase [Reticulomyxa filosa]|uniref:Beta-galactosidase n=1 Tax=Reticulomyxa filosa TaxID=46433 RepID=X6NXC9_RETFI|nr:beta-galactosidase [Reticulomyxa filosa]|eukprot:ETO29917.1 beta-galactosidase [Reticulomyxa filosa]
MYLNQGDFSEWSLYLQVGSCNNSQQWSYNATSGLLSLTNPFQGQSVCAYSTGSSNPVRTAICDSLDFTQLWSYSNSQFKSRFSSKCLDIYQESGPNVDEWSCKDPNSNDAQNQQWTWTKDGKLQSKYDSEWCLTTIPSNSFTFAYVYNSEDDQLTFLVNTDPFSNYSLAWNNIQYEVPGVSVSVIDFEGTELYNTAKVDNFGLPTQRVYHVIVSGESGVKWQSWTEQVPLQQNPQGRTDSPFVSTKGPLEQIRLSNESSEYMYYSTTVDIIADENESNEFVLEFSGRMANAYMLYIDNYFINDTFNYDHDAGTVNMSINLKGQSQWLTNGSHVITILSSSQGIHNLLSNQQGPDAQDKKGLVGDIILIQVYSTNNGQYLVREYNLTQLAWYQWIGLTGENLQVAGAGMSKVQWTSSVVASNAMTWYKTTFSIPESAQEEGVLLIDIGTPTSPGLRRGHFWLNGKDMGHYNNVILDELTVQRYYFVAYDDVNLGTNTNNTLIFAEELPDVALSNFNVVISNVVIP